MTTLDVALRYVSCLKNQLPEHTHLHFVLHDTCSTCADLESCVFYQRGGPNLTIIFLFSRVERIQTNATISRPLSASQVNAIYKLNGITMSG